MSHDQKAAQFQGPPGVPHNPLRHRPPSVFWPLVLIVSGTLLLLTNLGYLPWTVWNNLWRFWPVLLIALGLDVLIGRRSTVGAVISGVLVLVLIGGAIVFAVFGQSLPMASGLSGPVAPFQVEHIEQPVAQAHSAAISINWSSLPGQLGALADSSANLIEGDIAHSNQLDFDSHTEGDRSVSTLSAPAQAPWWAFVNLGTQRNQRWVLNLTPNLPIDLTLNAGSGSYQFDLSALKISALRLNGGSGPITLGLPRASTFEAKIEGGSGPLTLILPDNLAARVRLQAGSGPFTVDERFRLAEDQGHGNGIYETGNVEAADYTVRLEIDQGSGPIAIQ
jgi:hypothetical protein